MSKALATLSIFWATYSASAQFITPNVIDSEISAYSATFIAEWGGDTASIETFTVIGNHLFGRALHLYPEPHLRQFEFYYNRDGSIRSMNIQFYDLNNTSLPLQSKTGFLPYRIKMDAKNEVVDFRAVDKGGEKQYLQSIARMDFFGGWIPILGQCEYLARRLVDQTLDKKLKFVNYVIGDYDMEVKRISTDTILFNSDISAPITFILDENERINLIDARGSPWNYMISKTELKDVEDFAKRFAGKKVMGDPSPYGYFAANVQGAKLKYSYGQPSMRGRKIFGNIVPYDVIWRTGAGPSTKLTTDHDLIFESKIIPKGTYNIFTYPGKDKWVLVFNTEKDAWGSAPKTDFDFAKVDMQVSRSDDVVEKFKIEIEEKEEGGVMKLKWENTMAEIAFKIGGK